MMGISHECNTRDPLINRGCREITRRGPYPKRTDRGNVLGVGVLLRTPSQASRIFYHKDCIYFTIVHENIVKIVLLP